MKSIILTVSLLLATIMVSSAQNLPLDNNTGKITYNKVTDVTGMTAADIFKYTKEWGLAKGFKIKSEDAAKGEIIFDGVAKLEYPGKVKTENGNVNYTLHITAKEGKYRYIAIDFVHEGLNKAPSGGKLEAANPACGAAGMAAASWQLIKKKTQGHMESTITDLEKTMREIMNDPTKKSDW